MSRSSRILLVLSLLAVAGAAVTAVLWSRSVGSEIQVGKARLVAAGLPLSVADLEDRYTGLLGPERTAPLPLGDLIEEALRLEEAGLVLELVDREDDPEGGPGAEGRRALVEHAGLLESLRLAWTAVGRRLDFDLDPLSEDFRFQAGFRTLVQLARWEFERRVADRESAERVLEAGRLVLDCADAYSWLPHTMAQMERVSWCEQVWKGVRPALEAEPARAEWLLRELAAGPAREAARRAASPQGVLVVTVEEQFAKAAAGPGASRFGEVPGGILGWYWMRRDIPLLLEDVLQAHAALLAEDLGALQALDREIRADAEDAGTLYGLLAFSPLRMYEAELSQRDHWIVSMAGAEALGCLARTGAWPEDRAATDARAGFHSSVSELVVEMQTSVWRIEPPR